jgi:hypothetical protein
MRNILFFFTLFFASTAMAADDIEIPEYKVMQTYADSIEVREYAPKLAAEVTVEGDRSEAANKGFRILADFIFGKNAPAKEISMTAPVTQQAAPETIAMTAPVTQNSAGENRWLVRFMMPKHYSMQTLPKPINDRIKIIEIPAEKTVSITFSGFWTKGNLAEHQQKLAAFIKKENLPAEAEFSYAFYNDPFTFPWNRRNEIIYRLKP